MAKKKSETGIEKSAPAAAATKKEAPKRVPPSPAKASAAGSSASASGRPAAAQSIDTALAANAAAAMVAGNVSLPATGGQPKKDSAAFKQLKAGLNKPSAGALGGAFAVQSGKKKAITPLGGPKQVGHNQTFGADVNRTGVPRRTPG